MKIACNAYCFFVLSLLIIVYFLFFFFVFLFWCYHFWWIKDVYIAYYIYVQAFYKRSTSDKYGSLVTVGLSNTLVCLVIKTETEVEQF